ncbi:MAG: Eco57I restriction-modification methylase domain-containing protein [Bacteroidaceae bacterium]|nr:Eco57I restriction-modification methylase domain-containing protein [Bacteroidaceae bacterium]
MVGTYSPDSLRNLFQSSFNLAQWYSFLQYFFNASELKERPERLNENTYEEGFYLGSIDTTDSYRIGLFHYRIKTGSVANKRVGLRNLVRPFLKYQFDAALVVFDSGDHWRLSFICDIKEEATSPKRYTYVFGCPDLLYRTPIERFNILMKKGISFENLKTAFSVEALSDEFFDKYREQYADFIQYITGKRIVKVGSKWEEKVLCKPNAALMLTFDHDEKKIRDYIKKMMGRITFMHFLQRKGWMCGDLNYMQNMFKKSAYQNDYLDSVLEPLFFGILNTKPAERETLFTKYNWDKSLLKEWKDIPYLNGGLFERDAEDEPESRFPAEYFKRLFQFFSEYNFTIDENDPNDAEVGVDPEMLGKIFENLLEDNKDKGAFYTPKEIVRYMCQESLIAYLETNTSIAKDKIRQFVLSPEEGVADIPENKKPKLLAALEEVKICDPAIGSGAFPMGLLNELLHCREVLSGEHYDRAEIKKSIIQNNIYCVDIEKGAVDIARLRFWLSIVVDEETPSPLPNLDYKIMQGNSLIESFMGVDLSKLTYEKQHKKDKGEILLFDDEKNRQQKLVSQLLSSYYSCSDHDKKIRLRAEIAETINKQLEAQGYNPSILRELKNIDPSENNKFFLWHTWFSDVFNRDDKEGFDIVIGNPPYIGEKGHKEIFQSVKADIHLGQYYLGKMDYFYFFFHLAFNMLSPNGVATFITTNYYPTALGARRLRADIKDRMNIKTLFNLGELRLFENAPGQHNMISSFSKRGDYCKCQIIDVHKNGSLNPQMFTSIINHDDEDTTYTEIEQEDIYDGEENYIRLTLQKNTDNPLVSIINKMGKNNEALGNISVVNIGMRTGADKVSQLYIDKYLIDLPKNSGIFILTEKEKKALNLNETELDLLLPWFKNSDIQKYTSKQKNELWLIDLSYPAHENLDQAKYPNIYKHILQYRSILEGRRSNDNGLQAVLQKGYWWAFTMRQLDFGGEKIVAPQRSKFNCFGYNNIPWYASMDVYYITNPNKDYSLKYILGLLNSKLYYVWLYHKGKRKGETLELYQKPLSEIPIKKTTSDIQNSIVKIVDEIVAIKKSNPNHDTSSLERQIDVIVYKIYALTDAEIKIIEQSI